MPMAGGASLREAPVILSETMIFPYLRGLVFCASLTNDGGWKRPERRLPASRRCRPSRSSTPRNTATQPDPPTHDRPGHARRRARAGPRSAGTSSARCSSACCSGATAASRRRRLGRRPIRRVRRPKDGKLGLVWLSTWDSDDDAREFARGYARFQTTKMGDDIPQPDAFPDANRRPHQGTVFAFDAGGPTSPSSRGSRPSRPNAHRGRLPCQEDRDDQRPSRQGEDRPGVPKGK